jgi:hypothetical protein
MAGGASVIQVTGRRAQKVILFVIGKPGSPQGGGAGRLLIPLRLQRGNICDNLIMALAVFANE